MTNKNSRKHEFILYFVWVQIDQSIGRFWAERRNAFVLEKHLEPKKRCAENGDGWAQDIMWCLVGSMSLALLCAKLPHRRNTHALLCAEMSWMARSVNFSQPILACEHGLWALNGELGPIQVWTRLILIQQTFTRRSESSWVRKRLVRPILKDNHLIVWIL